MVGYVGQEDEWVNSDDDNDRRTPKPLWPDRVIPSPRPVPPPFRTWEEYRAALKHDKARRIAKEDAMHNRKADEAVELEVKEEQMREQWTRESLAKFVAEAVEPSRKGPDPDMQMSLPERDTRSSIIAEAVGLVTGERNQSYDAPERNFERIARHWEVFFKNRFGVELDIKPADVALMMDLMKTARLEFNITHKDSWVDKVGYSACGAECALNGD